MKKPEPKFKNVTTSCEMFSRKSTLNSEYSVLEPKNLVIN
jgi:hypothetical protein